MNFFLIKIIFVICIVISMNACHTFEHQNIFNQNINKNSNEKLLDKQNINLKFNNKKSVKKSEIAPINLPKQTEKVQKVALQKKVNKPNTNNFNLGKFLNWDEEKLIKTLGNSHFIKEEGKLKNYQYHFKECFLDVFLIKKNENYVVNYVETRPPKLEGKINTNECFKKIKKILN